MKDTNDTVVLVRITREEAAAIRAAATLAAHAEPRLRAGHLAQPLRSLAARLEELLLPAQRAA